MKNFKFCNQALHEPHLFLTSQNLVLSLSYKCLFKSHFKSKGRTTCLIQLKFAIAAASGLEFENVLQNHSKNCKYSGISYFMIQCVCIFFFFKTYFNIVDGKFWISIFIEGCTGTPYSLDSNSQVASFYFYNCSWQSNFIAFHFSIWMFTLHFLTSPC